MKELLILSVILIAGSFALPIKEEKPGHRWTLVPDGEGRMHLQDMNPIVLEPEPSFNANNDVFFLLFSRRNPTVGQRITVTITSVANSNWNSASLGTRFIIHGWSQDHRDDMNIIITRGYLANADHNVVGTFKNYFLH